MRAALLLLPLLLAGCAAAPVAGGAAGGAIMTAIAVNSDADTALKTAKPINQGLCLIHPFNPSSAEAQAAVAAFCAHLPDSTLGLLTQLFAIVEAVDRAHSAAPIPAGAH